MRLTSLPTSQYRFYVFLIIGFLALSRRQLRLCICSNGRQLRFCICSNSRQLQYCNCAVLTCASCSNAITRPVDYFLFGGSLLNNTSKHINTDLLSKLCCFNLITCSNHAYFAGCSSAKCKKSDRKRPCFSVTSRIRCGIFLVNIGDFPMSLLHIPACLAFKIYMTILTWSI